MHKDKLIEEALIDPSEMIEPTSHRVTLTIDDPDTEGRTIAKKGRFAKERG